MVTTNGTAHTALALEGTVGRVNDHGFTLAGRDGWLNFSKFAGELTLPDAGDHVLATLDKGGFVRACTVLSSTAAASQDAPTRAEPGTTGPVDRETRITRSACLNTAVAVLVSHGAVDPELLLSLAERLEAWVVRDATA